MRIYMNRICEELIKLEKVGADYVSQKKSLYY